MSRTLVTTFVVTDQTVADPETTFTAADITAAFEQGLKLVEAQESIPYDVIIVGCYSNGLIQAKINAPTRRNPNDEFNLFFQDPSQHGEAVRRLPADIPTHLLHRNHNYVRNVVNSVLQPRPGNDNCPVPDALILPDGSVTIRNLFPKADAFGQELHNTPAADLIAANFVDDSEPGYCQFLATEPVHELEHAKFKCEFLKAIAPYREHHAVQFTLARY